MGGYWRVFQHKSTIRVQEKYKKILLSLGLKHRGAISHMPINRVNAGKILKVKELVRVDQVDEFKTKAQVRKELKSLPGFEVVKY